jgi:tRNA(His) guanylyltransferase
MNDPLGDHLKKIEATVTSVSIPTTKCIYARLDGRAFSYLTRNFHRPFDERMIETMHTVTAKLVTEFNATIGYVQSDEISLLWKPAEMPKEHPFGGKVFKLTSVLPSFAAPVFFVAAENNELYDDDVYPCFDCRVVGASNEDATSFFHWRAMDAHRNAVQAMAQQVASPNKLLGVNNKNLIASIIGQQAYDSAPSYFKHGRFFRRTAREIVMPEEVRLAIPEQHRPDAGHQYTRHSVEGLDAFDFCTIQNQTEFLFGAEPILQPEKYDVR